LVTIDVEGNGFLYNMIRAIAGTLVEVGRGKRDAAWIAEVLTSRDRCAAGQTAPPHGLMLLHVDY
jgi:tRNA pseudouridine38-40 synthase